MQMMSQVGVLPFGEPKYFEVDFQFYFPVPDSWSKAKKADRMYDYHTVKPDIDTLQKFYMDAANGILWQDDKNISKISCVKVYGENAKTIITGNKYFFIFQP